MTMAQKVRAHLLRQYPEYRPLDAEVMRYIHATAGKDNAVQFAPTSWGFVDGSVLRLYPQALAYGSQANNLRLRQRHAWRAFSCY